MLRETMLMKLPEFSDKWELIEKNQTVGDIMSAVLQAHDDFEKDYDAIAHTFGGYDDLRTLENIFDFLKTNIRYNAEPASEQVVKSPSAIIETGVVDCKGYAGFIAGVLDAMNRKGADIPFCYVFAWYGGGKDGHVFVEAEVNGGTVWIDPVLSTFNARSPMPTRTRKFYKDMAIYKLSGIDTAATDTATPSRTAQQACAIPLESLDQQLVRLTNCLPGIDAGTMVPGSSDPAGYVLPVNEPMQPAPTVDALAFDPGTGPTMQQPATKDVVNPNIDNPSNVPTGSGTTPATTDKKGGVMAWIKDNPLLAALIIGGFAWAASRKRTRG